MRRAGREDHCGRDGGGLLSAGLVFRVGRADETLVTSGITHLLEHLVLQPIDRADLHFNGVTSPGTTTFRLDDADEAELIAFLDAVCAQLRDPAVGRVESEKAILRTEAVHRDRAAADDLALWRYGPAGYGLPGFPELGLDGLTGDDLRAWAAARFTRGNAALWISGGPPPAGLRLDLPDGARMPYPEASEVLPRLPAYFTSPVNGAVFDLVVPRSRASVLYAAVLDRRLFTRLRRELGVSYTAAAHYRPRDAAHAVVTAMADALPEHRTELCRAMVDVLIELSREAPSDDELTTARTLAGRAASAAGAAEELLAGYAGDDGEDVLAVGRHALGGALAMLPEGCAIGRAGFVRAPSGSAEAVAGVAFRPVNRPDSDARLILGADGVTLREGLRIATFRFAECRAMLAWPDGGRTLFGADAVTVTVEPTMWTMAPADRARLDAAVPAALTIAQPAREPDRVPQPPQPPPSAARRKTRIGRRPAIAAGAWVAVMAGLVVAGVPVILTVLLGIGLARLALFFARPRK